jgi:hypothetical protein
MSIVYILTNEAMPGYVKIGRTETSVAQRMSELDKTSTPLPFQCFYAARVDDYAKVERALHTAFGETRVRPSREFFRLDPYRAKVVLELIAKEDVTPVDVVGTDQEGQAALEQVVRRGSRFDFSEYGVPVGSVLHHAQDSALVCSVEDDQTVLYNGQSMSLSRAAGQANLDRGGQSTSFAGPRFWIFDGETLASRRDRLEDR